jgi:hypothetical protein
MSRFLALRLVVGIACLLIPVSLLASSDPDRVQFGHDIRIGPNDKAGDVTCIGCSVHVSGQVSGDLTTIAGSIFLEQGATIAGDVTVIAGNAHAQSATQVAGDLTAIGGDLLRDPQAAVAGDVTTVGGGRWIFLIFLMPFLFLGGMIALIIWMVQRSRHPAPVPAYTLRRS